MRPESLAWSAIESPGRALKLIYAALGLLALGLAVVLLGTILIPEGSGKHTVRFESAQRCVEPPLRDTFDRAGLARLLARPASETPGCWQAVALPARQAAQALSFKTAAPQLARARYRMRYHVAADWPAGQGLTIFTPRAVAWAWQISVNGHIVGNDLADWRMSWNRPAVVQLAPGSFTPGADLDIELALIYVPSVGHALPRITAGPAADVGRQVDWRQGLQIAMPQACSAMLLMLGAFFLSFWLARRQETAYLLLALASLAWSVCNLQYVLPRHDNGLLEVWYDNIVNVSIVWVMWLIYLIVLRFDPRRVPWVEWALPVYVLGMTLLAMPLWHFDEDFGLLFHSFNTTVAAGITALIVRLAWNGQTEVRVVAVALVLALLAGAQDVALIGMAVTPESLFLLPYSSVLVFGAFLFALQRRYVRAIGESEALRSSLAERLAAREEELSVYHARLGRIERDEALANERQRLMHDMHDGIGSALLTTLAAVERGRLLPHEVAAALSSCVDDLRLVIDSLEPMEHNLVTLLATLRYRLGPRLEASGLSLIWNVRDLPELPWLEAPDVLHLLRLLQEALTNVVKHASATQIRVTTQVLSNAVEVAISDNGCGFDVDATHVGRGLRSMRQRATRLGGELEIFSPAHAEATGGQGTLLRLRLPLLRPTQV